MRTFLSEVGYGLGSRVSFFFFLLTTSEKVGTAGVMVAGAEARAVGLGGMVGCCRWAGFLGGDGWVVGLGWGGAAGASIWGGGGGERVVIALSSLSDKSSIFVFMWSMALIISFCRASCFSVIAVSCAVRCSNRPALARPMAQFR